jgi:hypothetical protein
LQRGGEHALHQQARNKRPVALVYLQPWFDGGGTVRYARLAWTGERMHGLLEVHFGEDCCRIEDRNGEQNLTIIRKIARNMIKGYTTKTASQHPISNVMFDYLLEPENIRSVVKINEN